MHLDFINEEKEINLKDLLFNILKNWRTILIFSVPFMFFAVAFKLKKIFENQLIISLIISMIKTAVVGYIIGVFAIAFYYLFKFILEDSIKSAQEIENYTKLNLIGVVPKLQKDKENQVDFFIKRHICGISLKNEDKEKLIRCMAREIEVEKNLKSKDKVNIALVSSESNETAAEFANMINGSISNEVTLSVAGNIIKNPEGIDVAYNSDYIILVERQIKSKYSDLNQILRRLNVWNKEILGIVLLDVDAI